MVQQHFIGWDTPIAENVASVLRTLGPAFEFSKTLIIVPTQLAVRRLREEVAKYAFSSPQILTPAYFAHKATNSAANIIIKGVWARTLLLNENQAVCVKDFGSALNAGEKIEELRRLLAEYNLNFYRLLDQYESIIDEPNRWHELAKLEKIYLAELDKLGVRDVCEDLLENPVGVSLSSAKFDRVIVCGVPNPTPLMVKALRYLNDSDCLIDLLITAPPQIKNYFDEWGKPLAAMWRNLKIEIPDPEKNIIFSGEQWQQCERVITELVSSNYGAADIAIGVPVESMMDIFVDRLAKENVHTFNPVNHKVKDHPAFHLINDLCCLFLERSFEALRRVVLNPYILELLAREHDVCAFSILKELDKYQNVYLPAFFDDISIPAEGFTSFKAAYFYLADLMEQLASQDFGKIIWNFLQTIFDDEKILERENVHEFMQVADAINSTLLELESDALKKIDLGREQIVRLFLNRLSEREYHRELEEAQIDLEGWLELTWNSAPFLIVTNMNEGVVPRSQRGDMFLSNSLRTQIGLPNDEERLILDAFRMCCLIETRRKSGRVCFVAGRTGTSKEPLWPSRLLFRCEEKELLHLAEKFITAKDVDEDSLAATISFKLNPKISPDAFARGKEIERMSVTWFRDYLACPFRFYLKHVLNMQAVEPAKRGLDQLEFGIMIHHIFYLMAKDKEMSCTSDAHKLSDFLQSQAEKWICDRFGKSRPLSVEVALYSAKQRFNAAAKIQVALIADGWEILTAEHPIETEIEGMKIRGRIDRIDRHADGRIRLIDYKTSDALEDPRRSHLARANSQSPDYALLTNSKYVWKDLQLVLYKQLIPKYSGSLELDCDAVEAAEMSYFSLPKAVNETCLATWEESTEKLDALHCAEKIIARIKNKIFWPPTDFPSNSFDDFKLLFPGLGRDCFEEYLP